MGKSLSSGKRNYYAVPRGKGKESVTEFFPTINELNELRTLLPSLVIKVKKCLNCKKLLNKDQVSRETKFCKVRCKTTYNALNPNNKYK